MLLTLALSERPAPSDGLHQSANAPVSSYGQRVWGESGTLGDERWEMGKQRPSQCDERLSEERERVRRRRG
jgi:hypothetical protein